MTHLVVSDIFPLMNWHHYLLISNQDSFARAVVPSVLPQGDRLSMTSDAFEAFRMMKDEKTDAVLVAMDENDEDAAVLCRTVRRCSNLPIVMLVTHRSRDQVARGYRMGADAHIELPCDPRIFRARVDALVRRFEMQANTAGA